MHHLALAADWDDAVSGGTYAVSTRGVPLAAQGFVHASRADQVDGVADAFYADLADGGAVLLDVDADALREAGVAVVAEPGDPRNASPRAERFPHVYGAIPTAAVRAVRPWRGSVRATDDVS
nr:DUF952 domain-containing protein [Litorihabitans aurantiacus]